MRKLFPAIILCSLSFLKSSAQTDFRFADSTAQWNVYDFMYIFGSPGEEGNTIEYSAGGDTIISGLYYQKITQLNTDSVWCLRKDSTGKVSRWVGVAEVLLYDFGLHAGDTSITLPQINFSYNKVRVDSVDTVFLQRPRIRQHVRCSMDGINFDFPAVYIEGIGSLNTSLLYPGTPWEVLDGDGYNLLCFFENGQRLYHNIQYDTCNLRVVASVKEVQTVKAQVLPNPVIDGYANVFFEDVVDGKCSFLLFDITGRMISQKTLKEQTNQVELNDISPGLYLYNIKSSSGLNSSGKLIVE